MCLTLFFKTAGATRKKEIIVLCLLKTILLCILLFNLTINRHLKNVNGRYIYRIPI